MSKVPFKKVTCTDWHRSSGPTDIPKRLSGQRNRDDHLLEDVQWSILTGCTDHFEEQVAQICAARRQGKGHFGRFLPFCEGVGRSQKSSKIEFKQNCGFAPNDLFLGGGIFLNSALRCSDARIFTRDDGWEMLPRFPRFQRLWEEGCFIPLRSPTEFQISMWFAGLAKVSRDACIRE